jgi:uncharacterized coiled-coil protein SlyX
MNEEIDQKIAQVTEKLEKFRTKRDAAVAKVVERENRLKLSVWREKADVWEAKVARIEHKLRRLEMRKAKQGTND